VGSTTNAVFPLIFIACLTLVAITVYPEKTVQTGLQIVGGEADYVVFNDLIVVGGNVYIGGCSGSFENHVWTLWRISADGRIVSSTTGGKGYVTSLASDGLRIYVAGVLEHDALPKTTGFLAAFNTNLEKIWEKEWVGSPTFSHFESIAAGDSVIYVAGAARYSGERAHDIVLQKYDGNGSLLWERTFAEAGYQKPASMALHNGKIYIVGDTAPYGSNQNVDGLLLVTDENGNEVSRVSWGGEKRDYFKSVEVEDGVYVCGFTDSYGEGGYDGLLLKMDESGKVVWWRTFGEAGNDGFIDFCICNGRIHVVGHATTSRGMLPVYLQYWVNGTLLGNWTLSINVSPWGSSWTGVYPAEGAVYMVGNDVRGLFRNRGIYTSYVTSYTLTVNFPDDGFWASLDGGNKTGRSVSFEARGVEHRLEATPYKGSGETRLTFSMWSDGVADNPRRIMLNRDTVLDAVYKVEYHVTVSSGIGEASGEGWYVEGSTATVSVTPSIIPENFFINHVFEGWFENGERVSPSTVYSFVVTRPVHLVASWRTELNLVALLIIVLLVAILIIAVLLVFLIRRKRKKLSTIPPPPPPPDQA